MQQPSSLPRRAGLTPAFRRSGMARSRRLYKAALQTCKPCRPLLTLERRGGAAIVRPTDLVPEPRFMAEHAASSAEYHHGDMPIVEHAETYSGVMGMFKWGALAVADLLILLTLW